MSKIKPYEAAVICNKTLNIYRELLNSYVSDFYIENHWNTKLPKNWKSFLENLDVTKLEELLDYEKSSLCSVIPLTFLCLRQILTTFSVSRKHVPVEVSKLAEKDAHFLKFFWKNVKMKKRHEIEIMAELCYQKGLKINCFNIVDVGSGLGHLSRLLAYQYGFNVCTFEVDNSLVKLARELDNQFEKILNLKGIPHICKSKPVHINKRIEETLCHKVFGNLIRDAFNNYENNFKFGIVGLHPCGNLGSTLLRLYNQSPNSAFINMVSCCYMKLSLEPSTFCGFPQSNFYRERKFTLNYLSCETACHAIENYREKIIIENRHLKIHSFRAALECLLVAFNQTFRHSAVSNVKYEEDMTFKEYCMRATKKYDNLMFNNKDFEYYEQLVEETWENVVKFYSVRLLLAPLVESSILYDRALYLKENQSECDIIPVFECHISPRNHVLSTYKLE